MKLLLCNGLGWGIRGGKEQTFLEIKHVAFGQFDEGHEFYGCDWYGYDNLTDKSHKLSTTNGIVRKMQVIVVIHYYIIALC